MFISARRTTWRGFLPGRGYKQKRAVGMTRVLFGTEMRNRMLKLALIGVLLSGAESAETLAADALKKIRIASKGGGETLLPYLISQRLGFYRDEGLDVDVIVTR